MPLIQFSPYRTMAAAAPPVSLTAAVINASNQYRQPLVGSWVPCSFRSSRLPSANLAGTASILTQWWIGQGVEAFGFAGVASNLFQFASNPNTACWFTQVYKGQAAAKVRRVCPGPVLLQQPVVRQRPLWRHQGYGVSRSRSNFGLPAAASGLNGMEWAMGDNAQTIQQVSATLWYRPIQAIKFGLQYSYAAAHYYPAWLPF